MPRSPNETTQGSRDEADAAGPASDRGRQSLAARPSQPSMRAPSPGPPTFDGGHELERGAMLFALLFLAGAILVVGRSARDALFLTKFPVGWIAPMWIAYAVVSSIAALGYARFADRLPRAKFVAGFATVSAVTYVVLRVLIGLELRPAYLAFYVWSDVIANFTTVAIWTMAQDLYDARSAKRVFGIIGAGQVAGAVVSGFSTGAIVGLVGTENLLIVLAVALLGVGWLARVLARRHPMRPPAPREERVIREHLERNPIWRSRYVMSIAAMTALIFVALTIGDYQFKATVRASFPVRDELARYMANFYGVLGLLSLAVQLFITPPLLRRFGVLAGMIALPIAFIAGSVGLMVSPGLLAASMLKGSDNGLQYTVHEATMQLLFFPFPEGVRDRVRTLIGAIVKPVGCGLGAVALILIVPGATAGGHEITSTAATLGRFTVPVLLLAIALAPLVRRKYLGAMRGTLMRRELSPVDVIRSPSTLAVLEEALGSPGAPQVIFAVDRLRELAPERLSSSLPTLAMHHDARVRALTLGLSWESADRRSPELARAALKDPDGAVRVAAVEALAASLREDAHDDLLGLADTAGDDGVKSAAIAGLLRFCGLDGMLDGAPRLRALLESERPADRVAAARVLGMVGEASLQRALARLLADAEPEVRRAAIEAASAVCDPRLLPLFLEALAFRPLAPAAARAITALGAPVVPELAARLADPKTPRAARLALPRVLLRVGVTASLDALVACLDEPDDVIRQKILASASRLRLALGAPGLPAGVVRGRIDAELRHHEEVRDAYLSIRALVSRPLLDEHVVRRLRKGLIRILRLCELAYPREVVASARSHLFGSDSRLRANALEVLESLLDRALRERLVRDVERFIGIRGGTDVGPRTAPSQAEAAVWIRAEIASGDPYRAAVALDAVGCRRIGAAADTALATLGHADPLVREAAATAVVATSPPGAAAALERLLADQDDVVAAYARYWRDTHRDGFRPTDSMYTTIEKVLFLQRVPVFSRVAGDDLVPLARCSPIVHMSPGDVIFREGDPGGALYFIVSGKVTLTVEQREVAELGDNEVFGEMSIFDREPRGTTATVAEDTELLRVSASEFHDSVRDSVDLAEAVIQVMNFRLRDADRRLSAARTRLAALTKTPEREEPRIPAHPAEVAAHAPDDEVE